MAKGRMISKKISENRNFNILLSDDTSRLMFIMTIPHLDVDGRIIGEPFVLRSKVLPWRHDISESKAEQYIKEWVKAGFVKWYEIEDTKYLWFPQFENNQPGLRKEREIPSNIPPYRAGIDISIENSGKMTESIRNQSGINPESIRQNDGKMTAQCNAMEFNEIEYNKIKEKEREAESFISTNVIPFPGSHHIQLEEKKDFSLPLFKKFCIEFMKIYNQRNGQVMSPTGGNYTKAADIFNCPDPEKLYNQAILVIDYFFDTPFWFNTEKAEPGKIKKHLCTLGIFLAHLPAIISDYNEKKEADEKKIKTENAGGEYSEKLEEIRAEVDLEREEDPEWYFQEVEKLGEFMRKKKGSSSPEPGG